MTVTIASSAATVDMSVIPAEATPAEYQFLDLPLIEKDDEYWDSEEGWNELNNLTLTSEEFDAFSAHLHRSGQASA